MKRHKVTEKPNDEFNQAASMLDQMIDMLKGKKKTMIKTNSMIRLVFLKECVGSPFKMGFGASSLKIMQTTKRKSLWSVTFRNIGAS